MLDCDQTVTLLHMDPKTQIFSRAVLRDVEWHSECRVTVGERGLLSGNLAEICIPAENLPDGIWPSTGDYFIWGEISGDTKIAGLSDINALSLPWATVIGVSDNRKGGLAHVAVTCKGGNL